MYAAALTLSGVTAAATTGVPFFQLGSIGPIQSFGIIVAAGVLIGAALLRRYAEWHGVSDDDIRGITGWITVTGFLGAHLFDVLAYQWDELMKDPVLLVKLWSGISSYGGFLGGALGFAIYVWWKRLPVRLFADISLVGLLPAFSIGRIGCTVVSDHVGAAVKDPDVWYSFLAMDYPREAATNANIAHLFHRTPETVQHVLAWNLGLVELLYLVPVNALVLWLAFRSSKRVPAGFVAVMIGLLYAPVRFYMDYLRPENSDPRHFGLTFAQWSSILAFLVSGYVAAKILQNGKAAPTVAKTSGEAQARLRVILKEDEEAEKKGTSKGEGAKKSSGDDADDEKQVPKAVARKAEPKRKSSADDDDKDDDAKDDDAKSAKSAKSAKDDE